MFLKGTWELPTQWHYNSRALLKDLIFSNDDTDNMSHIIWHWSSSASWSSKNPYHHFFCLNFSLSSCRLEQPYPPYCFHHLPINLHGKYNLYYVRMKTCGTTAYFFSNPTPNVIHREVFKVIKLSEVKYEGVCKVFCK